MSCYEALGGRGPLARPLVAALVLALPAASRAHDLWLEPGGEGLVLRYGHRGGELLPLDAARVKAARCLGGSPSDLRPTARPSAKALLLPARCEAATAFLDGGFWTLTPDGEVNRPRTEVAQPVRSWASRQYAKWIDVRSKAAALVAGEELELVPVTDLARARAGDKVTLRVLSAGRPVKDAVVSLDHRPLGETDSAGEVRLRLPVAGLETVSATLRRRLGRPEAETEVLEASLTFEVLP